MDQQEAALRQSLQNSGVNIERRNDNIVITMPDAISFATGRAYIQPQFYATLNNLAYTLNQYPETRIQIEGHTDNVGSDSDNLRLSQQRAESVRNYLASNGIMATRMQAIGYGESRPLADNNSDYGRAQNRRVEITHLCPLSNINPRLICTYNSRRSRQAFFYKINRLAR